MNAFAGDRRGMEALAKSWLGLLGNLRADGGWCCDPADAEGWTHSGEEGSRGAGEHDGLCRNDLLEDVIRNIEYNGGSWQCEERKQSRELRRKKCGSQMSLLK